MSGKKNKDKESKDKPSEERNNSKKLKKDFKELKEKLNVEKNKSSEYLELLKRTQADFQNYKKRVNKDIKEEVFQARKQIILNFLSFKNTLEIAYKNENNKETKEHIKQLLLNLKNILKRLNIEEVDYLNKEFDYNLCECVFQKPVSSKKLHNKVIEIVEKGYLLNNKLIKPAKVVVGKKEEKHE